MNNTIKVELNGEYTRDCAIGFNVVAYIDVGADVLDYKCVCDCNVDLSAREFQEIVEAYEQHKNAGCLLMNHIEIYDNDENEEISNAIGNQCLKVFEKLKNLDTMVKYVEFTFKNGNHVTGCI